MTVGSTPASMVNRALQEIAAQATVTGVPPVFDNSAAGLAAGILYPGAITLLLRQQDYEFARRDVNLTLQADHGYPWAYAYTYPADCLKVRQVAPATWDQNDPQAVRWEVMELDGGKIIACNVPTAVLTYTTSGVTEAQFDSVFEETLVRYLASELVMSLGGRPDFSEKMLEHSGMLVGLGAGKDS